MLLLSTMKEMHLLPSVSFSVALSKSVMSAAVPVLQPKTKVKQKLRGAPSTEGLLRQWGHSWGGLSEGRGIQ